MSSESRSEDLKSRSVDYVAGLARGVVGPVPIFGPLLTEVITVTIPNQRIDRVAKFSEELERRLSQVEKCILEAKISDDNFTDLIEEGIRQAARSLSDERRQYIATLIGNRLTSDDIDYAESKHLLRILDEINDVEVIWLRLYRDPYLDGDNDFRDTHENVLKPVVATLGAPSEIITKAALQKSYLEHLCQLGLLEIQYRFDREKGLPEFDLFSGSMEEEGYELTKLGDILLNEIGLGKENQTP